MPQQSSTDRLILALVAQLRAERETRRALAFALENEAVDRNVLLAMLEDPIPAIALDDLSLADSLGEGRPTDPVRLS